MGIKLRTDWELEPGSALIDHKAKILLVGSCFSEHISNRLRLSGFNVLENPHGIVFQPEAVERCLTECIEQRFYEEKDLVWNGQVWASLNHHGGFNNEKSDSVLESINASIREAHLFIKEASHLVLTLGTAWAYRHLEKDQRVANCHKIPQKEFKKELQSVKQIHDSLKRTVTEFRKVNPSVTILLTVSPVRHIKDGIIENTRSKARLHEAVHQMVSDEADISYFPSYELMMDDLRDYRFYKSDLIHPNETAVEYIWEKFCGSWIDSSAKNLMKEAESIHRSLKHRPLQQDSEGHKAFQSDLQNRIEKLQKNYPELRLYQEKE